MLSPIHRKERLTLRDYLQYLHVEGYVSAALLMLGVVAMVGFLYYYVNAVKQDDLAESTAQTATGTVVQQSVKPFGHGAPQADITVRIKGLYGEHRVRMPIQKLSTFQPGNSLKVHYRIGRSGSVYIDHVEPVSMKPPAKTAQGKAL